MRHLLSRLEDAGVPAKISNSAGTYVCNFLFYRLQDLSRGVGMNTCRLSGFVHVPYLPEQVINKPGVASMEFDVLKRGFDTIIDALA